MMGHHSLQMTSLSFEKRVDHPSPLDYHKILNTGLMDLQRATETVVPAIYQFKTGTYLPRKRS